MQNSFKNKKIAFFGTPDFTVEFLELLSRNGINISLIVTGEDKPFGRGMQMKEPGPKTFAIKNNIRYLQPKKLDEDFFFQIKDENFDLFIVIAYGKIIPEKIIELPKFGTINLHYSLLPKLRGASPVETSLLNGDTKTGITIQKMKFKLDSGKILYQEILPIDINDTTSTLRDRLNKSAQNIFTDFLAKYFNGNIDEVEQEETAATHCHKFKKEDLNVTKNINEKDLETLFKKYKAFDGKIFFIKNNLRVKITEMKDGKIIKVLPESKKEIPVELFEKNYFKIFE